METNAAAPAETVRPRFWNVRDVIASRFGISDDMKAQIYEQLFESASLRDIAYWMEVIFSCGIATLGLILDSPAVIIGAMLISPLMGPILASGLSLSSGDFVLGIRSTVKLALSATAAIVFAAVIVYLLPFREMTGEIAGRTHPNTLDLFVALLSGAIGALATCKSVKGVVTSIPGVAIAVALMPPLCVVGYGIGTAMTVDASQGLAIARGGGLLFLTNLVAITFMAMLIFLVLHIDVRAVQRGIIKKREEDPESRIVVAALKTFRVPERFRAIGSLPGRVLTALAFVIVISIPLNQSFSQLRDEIARKQEENRIRSAVTEAWQRNFQTSGGAQRSFLDDMTTSEQDGKLNVILRLFVTTPYTPSERDAFRRIVADRLNRSADSVAVQLLEIPTTSAQLASRAREEVPPEKPQPTLTELETQFTQTVDSTIRDIQLPAPARLISWTAISRSGTPLSITVRYLSDRPIDPDARALLAGMFRQRLSYPNAVVDFVEVPRSLGTITFGRNQSALTPEATATLDQIAQTLAAEPKLHVEVTPTVEASEKPDLATERAKAITDYLRTTWSIAPDRVDLVTTDAAARTAELTAALPTK